MPRRRIAVIGSNSFSGSDFIDLLLEEPGNEVLAASRSAERGPLFLPYLRHTGARVRFEKIDLNHDVERLMRLLDEFTPEYVVNFAAQSEVAPSWQHPEHWFATNTVSLAAFINKLKDRAYVRKYVHISSPEVYGTCVGNISENAPLNPTTPYAASKAAADLLLATFQKNFDFPLVTVRSTNVYGAHQQLFKIIPRSVINLKRGKAIELHGGGLAVKSYIHIRDVSRGELAIMQRGTPGAIYHLSPDGGVAVRDVVRTICERLGQCFEASTVAVAERLGQDAAYVIDSSKARSEFGWRPAIALREGLEGVVSWIERYWDEIGQTPLEYVHKT